MANPLTVTQVRVSYRNAKFVGYNDQTWQAEGHDACRAKETCAAYTTTPPPHNGHSTRSSLVPLGACPSQSLTRFACVDRRSRSDHMEWCLKRSDQVEVISVERFECGACE